MIHMCGESHVLIKMNAKIFDNQLGAISSSSIVAACTWLKRGRAGRLPHSIYNLGFGCVGFEAKASKAAPC